MPFVTQEHRNNPDMQIPGDRCYAAYCEIMKQWNESPRWTTIDTLWKKVEPDDYKRAYLLALIVHMGFHGLPYEERKAEENGQI